MQASEPARYQVPRFEALLAEPFAGLGVAPHVVSECLSHAKVSFTMQVYGHVLPTQQAEAAEKLAELLGGTQNGHALPAPA